MRIPNSPFNSEGLHFYKSKFCNSEPSTRTLLLLLWALGLHSRSLSVIAETAKIRPYPKDAREACRLANEYGAAIEGGQPYFGDSNSSS